MIFIGLIVLAVRLFKKHTNSSNATMKILGVFIMSLRVSDFRMDFYAAALISILISAAYLIMKKIHPEK